MAHVTVPEVTPFIEYAVGSGGQTVFTIPSSWAFFDVDTDIRVFKDGVELTYDATPADATEFSVAGTSGTDSGFNGGTVTLGASVASCTIALQRDVPVKRTEDFPYPSSTFNIQALNTALDKIAAWAQQFRLIFNRSIRLADGDSDATLTLPIATERADKVLGFDGSGNVSALVPNTDAYISASAFGLTLINAADAAAGRTLFGLGTAAVLNVGTSANNVVQLNGSGQLPAVDASLLTGIGDTADQLARDMAMVAFIKADDTAGVQGPIFGDAFTSDSLATKTGADYDAVNDLYESAIDTSGVTIDSTPGFSAGTGADLKDGDTGTTASVLITGSANDEIFDIDLGSAREIASVVLRDAQVTGSGGTGYRLRYSADDVSYTTFGSDQSLTGGAGAVDQTISATAVTARYWRVALSGGTTSRTFTFSEVEFDNLPRQNVTLRPSAITLTEADPSDVALYAVVEEVSGADASTNVKARVSIDNGSTYTTAAVADSEWPFTSDRLLRFDADVSGQTGSQLIWEITSENNQQFKVKEVRGVPINA